MLQCYVCSADCLSEYNIFIYFGMLLLAAPAANEDL